PIAICWWFNSFSQERKLPVVPASKVAALRLPAGMSKIENAALPDKVQLGRESSSSLYSPFTRGGASGDYYRMGNIIIRVRGIERYLPVDDLQKRSKNRFQDDGQYESREFEVINGSHVLIIAIE